MEISQICGILNSNEAHGAKNAVCRNEKEREKS